MKKFIKRRWLVLLGVFSIALLVGFLYHKGFRITFAPELETSWDAVSAVAAWAGLVASFIAIWYAIQVPKKIADRQDKIALFEKRYECFQLFEKCYSLYAQIKDKECTLEELRERSKYILGKLDWADISREVAMTQIEQYEYTLHQMDFLFPGIDENDTCQLYMRLLTFLASIIEDNNVNESKRDYVKFMDYFCIKYTEIIFDSLKI